jgi:hypothetical protein
VAAGLEASASGIIWRIKHEAGGPYMFNYYHFLNKYGREPVDFLDFLDGITVSGILAELEGPRF